MQTQRHDARGAGLERRSLVPQEGTALSRWEWMWEEALLSHTEGRRRLFSEEPLGALEEMELRRDLRRLQGHSRGAGPGGPYATSRAALRPGILVGQENGQGE